MCLMTLSKKGTLLGEEDFRASYRHNSDGMGVMFVAEGRVQVIKSMGKVDDHLKVYEKVKGIPHVLHQRYATHGEKTLAMCHPFRITEAKSHGLDVWMMHNGILSLPTPRKGKSDTHHFVKDMLRPLLMKNPHLIHFPLFQQMLGKFIGSGNKLVFLDNENRSVIVNQEQGKWDGDFWYSNTYSLKGVTRSSNPANVGYFRGEDGDYEGYGGWGGSSGVYGGHQNQSSNYGYWKGNRWISFGERNHPPIPKSPPSLPNNPPALIPPGKSEEVAVVEFDAVKIKPAELEDDSTLSQFEVHLATLNEGQMEKLTFENPEAMARFVSIKHGAP